MNILHVGKYYPPFKGGMECFLKDLAQEQAKTNKTTVFVHNHEFETFFSKQTSEKNQASNLQVTRLKSLKPILFTPLMFGLNQTFNKQNNQTPFDVIHIAWPNPSALFLLLNKQAKSVPWVVQWQSDMVTKHSSWLLKLAYVFFKPLEKKLLKKASKIIVSSEEYLNHSQALQAFKSKCEVISLALKDRDKNHAESDLQWAQKLWQNQPKKIFTIGRLTFYKNHFLLIEAAQRLPETQFVIAGSGQLEKQLKQQIKLHKLENIKIVSGVSDAKINALFKTCDAFCLPSNDRAESFGLVLLEALQFNKPILVSDLAGSGMRWIASQSALGKVFDSHKVEELVELIQNLNDNSNLETTIPKPFQIAHCADKIQSVYSEITQS